MKTCLQKWIYLLSLFFLITFGARSQDVVRTVVADCFVRTGSGVQTQDYHLLKHSGGTDRRPYLRFDISDIDTTKIKSVHVSMYLKQAFTNPNSMALKLYKVLDNTWDEATQSWPGPVFDSTACADFTIDSIVGWKQSADLSAYLKQQYKNPDKLLSLAVFSDDQYNSTLNFNSKETVGGNPPVLQVYYEIDTTVVYDTVVVYDTIAINDTIWHNIYDTVRVTVYDSVKIAVEDTLKIDISVTGLGQPSHTAKILVYPNPAKNMLHINCKEYAKLSGYKIKLFDALSVQKWSSEINQDIYSIDISAYAPGIYFMEVFDGENKRLDTRKILMY
jgi:hypothetical protein